MGVGEQLKKIKDNWLLILLPIFLIFLFFFLSSGVMNPAKMLSNGVMESAADYSRSSGQGYYGGIVPPMPQGGFAPDVKVRKITKTSSLSSEVEKGAYAETESRLRSIVQSSGSFILNENVNTYDSGWRAYRQGSYVIKIDSTKYDDVLSQLKSLGKVKSFTESSDDITGQYQDLNIEIAAEKERLERYDTLYKSTTQAADKLTLVNSIFDQQRRVAYLEEQLKNMDQRVDYSTVNFQLQEKRPEYAQIVFVKFSQLVTALVNSVNSLLYLIFILSPWIVVGVIIWGVTRLFKRKR